MSTDIEGLIEIPLVQQLLNDSSIPICLRGIDRTWQYHGCFRESLAGFHPTAGRIFVAKHSAVAEWLKNPQAHVEGMNAADRLVREVLFLVHDHLHVWATQAIRSLVPELGFGEAPITGENFESMVFAMLLTEAAATVGLDYWYLSTIELSRSHALGAVHVFP